MARSQVYLILAKTLSVVDLLVYLSHYLQMSIVAVIGASTDRRKFGNKAVRAFLRSGYKVVAINPSLAAVGGDIEGCDTYGNVVDVPYKIDLATLYVQPHIGRDIVWSLVKKNIPELWVNPGAESPELVELAQQCGMIVREHCSIVAIGESPVDYE